MSYTERMDRMVAAIALADLPTTVTVNRAAYILDAIDAHVAEREGECEPDDYHPLFKAAVLNYAQLREALGFDGFTDHELLLEKAKALRPTDQQRNDAAFLRALAAHNGRYSQSKSMREIADRIDGGEGESK